MGVRFEIQQIQGRPAPGMRLEVLFEGKEVQGELDEVLSFSGSIWYCDTLVAPSLDLKTMKNSEGDFTYIQKDHQRLRVEAGALVIPDALTQIEAQRGDEDLLLEFRLHFTWKELPIAGIEKSINKFTISEQLVIPQTIKRSDWVRILGELNWSEIQSLEIPSEAFQVEGVLGDVPKHLARAQKALRAHDFESVLTQCRKAIDASSMADGPATETFNQVGWGLLLNKAYPGDPDQQGKISEYAKTLKVLLQAGPHVRGRTPSRPEALFSFAAVSSLFMLLAKQIQSQSTHE